MEVTENIKKISYETSPGNIKFVGVLGMAHLEKLRRAMACDGVQSIKWSSYGFYEDIIAFKMSYVY